MSGELCRLIKRPYFYRLSPLILDPNLTRHVLVLVRDLIIASRIAVVARAVGVGITQLRDPAGLAAVENAAGRLIVDLNQTGALDAAVEWKKRTGGEVIGFVAHVDAETIRRARDTGIDQVMPRSRFVTELESLLRAGDGSRDVADDRG